MPTCDIDTGSTSGDRCHCNEHSTPDVPVFRLDRHLDRLYASAIGIRLVLPMPREELREIVRMTPIDRLLVETDAPYLTPEPVRNIKTWKLPTKNWKFIAALNGMAN